MFYKQEDVVKTVYELMKRFGLQSQGWDHTQFTAREIRLAHRVLERNATARCDGIERWDEQARMRLASWTDEDEARAEKSDAKAEARVKDALRSLFGNKRGEVSVHFQGDPRGALIVIELAGTAAQGSAQRVAAW